MCLCLCFIFPIFSEANLHNRSVEVCLTRQPGSRDWKGISTYPCTGV